MRISDWSSDVCSSDLAAYDDPDKIKDALVRQLYNPVRWIETVERIHEQGSTNSAECGPGKVLTGLVKRINPDRSEERRVGKECGRTCRSRGSPSHKKNKKLETKKTDTSNKKTH